MCHKHPERGVALGVWVLDCRVSVGLTGGIVAACYGLGMGGEDRRANYKRQTGQLPAQCPTLNPLLVPTSFLSPHPCCTSPLSPPRRQPGGPHRLLLPGQGVQRPGGRSRRGEELGGL